MRRTPPEMRAFLVEHGWEPVPATGRGQIPITMWRDPLPSPGLGGCSRHQVVWPREAELQTERRLAVVRSVMED